MMKGGMEKGIRFSLCKWSYCAIIYLKVNDGESCSLWCAVMTSSILCRASVALEGHRLRARGETGSSLCHSRRTRKHLFRQQKKTARERVKASTKYKNYQPLAGATRKSLAQRRGENVKSWNLRCLRIYD